VKTDKSGGTVYIYTVGDDPPGGNGHHNGNGYIPKPEAERAEVDTLHAIYSALLGMLTLNGTHRENLRDRGLPEKDIDAREYRSLLISGRAKLAQRLHDRFGDKVLTVPGIVAKEGDRGRYLTIRGAAGCLIPVRDAQGRIVALKSRSDDAKGDSPKYSYLSSVKDGGPGPGSPVHLPLGISGPVERVRLTEGALKADIATALSGMPTISLPGVSNGSAAVATLKALGVQTVLVSFDADASSNETVARALRACIATLTEAGFGIELELWDGTQAKGIDDALAAGLSINVVTGEQVAIEVKRIFRTAKRAKKAGGRVIVIGTDEHRVNDEAVAALGTCEQVYQRGGKLVHIVRDIERSGGIERPKGSPTIVPLPLARLRELLSQVASFVTIDGEGKVTPARPPEWCYRAVDARGHWPEVRHLEAIVETPVLLADGTVLQKPGYDARSGLLYEPQAAFPPVPEHPTKADALRACAALREVAIDFPFKSEAHWAAWLAATITPFARHAYFGPAPLFLIDANTPGTGKTLLTDCTSHIISGRPFPRAAMPDNDDETRKRITSIAMLGEKIILFDNIAGAFGTASLDAALTATSWSDRLLGKNEWVANLPLLVTWYATGNNVQPVGDTPRRICHIRIESRVENPEERGGFRHPDLMAWVKQERPRLVVAALTILRAYYVDGRPNQKLTPWGSFDGWSGTVRSALVFAEQPDPAQTRIELRQQSDRNASTLRLLVTGWEEVDSLGRGLTVAAALKALEDEKHFEALRNAFIELTPPGKTFSARGLGMRMKAFRLRVSGGKYLDCTDTSQGQSWRVYRMKSDTRDTCDTISPGFAGTRTCAREEPLGHRGLKSVSSPSSVTEEPEQWGADPEFMAS
jgi:hypothetical protein